MLLNLLLLCSIKYDRIRNGPGIYPFSNPITHIYTHLTITPRLSRPSPSLRFSVPGTATGWSPKAIDCQSRVSTTCKIQIRLPANRFQSSISFGSIFGSSSAASTRLSLLLSSLHQFPISSGMAGGYSSRSAVHRIIYVHLGIHECSASFVDPFLFSTTVEDIKGRRAQSSVEAAHWNSGHILSRPPTGIMQSHIYSLRSI